jgi:hypothetical protein
LLMRLTEPIHADTTGVAVAIDRACRFELGVHLAGCREAQREERDSSA